MVSRYDIPALEGLLAAELIGTGGPATEVPPGLASDSVADSTPAVNGGTVSRSPQVSRRGTTNGNARGGSEQRRRRREWLVATYRADVDIRVITLVGLGYELVVPMVTDSEGSVPACRCYRCGALLSAETVTVDRIKPGAHGGTYRRDNIRPACGRCNASTGATVRRK